MRTRRLLYRLIRRFRRSERAVAAVEFALILPFLLLLYMGSIEASSLFTVDRRIEVIAATMADLVARWNPNEGAIGRETVRDYFRASEGIITPYSTVGLRQVVSVIDVAANGTSKVMWSCGYNGGTKLPKDQAYPLKDEMVKLVTAGKTKRGYLVASTTTYSYRPLLGMVFPNAITMESEALFLPRFQQTVAPPDGGCPT